MKLIGFLIFSLVISTNFVFCQKVTDLGKMGYREVKTSQDIEPCEVTEGKVLTYCVIDGSRVAYLFKNEVLNGIMFQTPYLSKSQAEAALEREVISFERRNSLRPAFRNGQALFSHPNSNISVSFGLRDFKGTTYLIYYTWLIY